jgi:hypothetical protein
MAIVFDSLQMSKRLQSGGFSQQQADTAVSAALDATTQLVTNDDLEKAIYQQTIKLGAMIFASAGLVVAAIKLWN